jgi:hypothetical protein
MGIVNGKAMKFFVPRIECSGPDRVRWGTGLAATRSLAANSGKENLLLEHVNVISPVSNSVPEPTQEEQLLDE